MKKNIGSLLSPRMMFRFSILLLLVGAPALLCAQTYYPDMDRTGHWDFTLTSLYQEGAHIDFKGGSSMRTDSDYGFAIGMAYYLNQQFSLKYELDWNSVDYTANVAVADTPGQTTRMHGSYYQWTTFFGGDLNLLKSRFTPYISGALGWAWIDTNIPTGRPVTGCWWDPWYGYICSTSYPTKMVDAFTYKAGVGLRFDVSPRFFIKGGYEIQWYDLKYAKGIPDVGVWKVDLGFLF